MSRESRFSSENFGDKLYRRLPSVYREEDSKVKFALKRFLDVCAEGGFKYVIEELNGLLDIVDSTKVDSDLLPLLFREEGFDLFYGIPETYLRYFLPKLGEAYSKKGSLDVIQYIVAILSGIKTIVVMKEVEGNVYIDVKLEMDYAIGDFFPNSTQFNRILKQFIPYYVDTTLIYAYLFYEYATLRGIEKHYDTLKLSQKDEKLIQIGERESLIVKVKKMEDSINLITGSEKSLNQIFVLNSPKSKLNESYIFVPDVIDKITVGGNTRIAFPTLNAYIE